MVRFLIILVILLQAGFIQSCKYDLDLDFDENGVVTTRKYAWKAPVNHGPYFAHGLRATVTYEGGILAPCATDIAVVEDKSSKGGLVMLDIETGQEKWRWADYMYSREYFDFFYSYQLDNRLILPSGPRTHCLDLSTGKTLWRKWKEDSIYAHSTLSGVGENYFYTGHSNDKTGEANVVNAVYKGNVLRPEPEVMLANPQLPVEYFGITPIPYGATCAVPTVVDGDTLLVIGYQTPTADAVYNIIRSVYGLYNLTKKEWVYKDIPLTDPDYGTVIDGLPVIYNGKVYMTVDKYLTCHELSSGRRLWSRRFNNNFLFSGFLIAEDIIVANCEDTYIYGIDPNSGGQIWREKSAGTSTRLIYQDGFVYYVGGSDMLLHAVEVKSGKTHWKLRSPDTAKNQDAYFFGYLTGVPASNSRKGRIFANTGLNIYCYEAIR